jgi:hypothetical protein
VFQLRVPGDGDDTGMVVIAPVEPLYVVKTAEGETQTESSQKDVEASVGAKRVEV